VYEIKPYLIQLLVKHQTNTRLLSLDDQSSGPLRVFVHLSDQNTYIRKIASKKIYETLNFDSIIRGPKQKEVLLPTPYSDRLDERKELRGNANVAESATIAPNARIRRSCIGAGCKIGKNVEILSSIILDNVELKENCRIVDSVLGSGCVIGEGVSIKGTYAESGCRVADGASLESEVLIRSE
jgi:NDP-sugar pyrophosphorylase family protein